MPSPPEPRHIAGTTTRLIIGHLRGRVGEAGVVRILARAGDTRSAAELADESRWSSYPATIGLLEAARDELGDPEVGHRIGQEAMGHREGSPLVPLLVALGSPGEVVRHLALASSKLQAVGEARAVELDADSAVVTFQNHDGFPRHRLYCDYLIGLLSQIPRLFGLPPATVRHTECQVDGAERCRYRVSWRDGLAGQARIDHLEDRLLLVSGQVRALESSAADLVSADDIDTVLARIAARAAAAVRAPAHLLAVHPVEGGPRRVVGEGIEEEAAAHLADELLAPEVAADPRRVVADVTSALRHYGRIAAVHPDEGRFFPEERRLLGAYARHAAAALDAATALDEARRGERRANLLLDLAHGLARATTAEEVATRLAQAVVELAGSGSAAVFLRDGDGAPDSLRLAATAGAPDPSACAGAETTVPIEGADRRWGDLTATLADGGPADGLGPELSRSLQGLADQGATALHNVDLLARVRHQSLHDDLTGLPNAVLFRDRLDLALAGVARDGGHLAVCFLDLDRFKLVNDRLGHAAGDDLLRQVAARLLGTVRAVDTVARLAGDEFTILVPDVDGPGAAGVVADKVLAAMSATFRVPGPDGGHDVRVSPSIGIALAPDHGTDGELLVARADSAMYRAKEHGRSRFAVYDGAPSAARPAPS